MTARSVPEGKHNHPDLLPDGAVLHPLSSFVSRSRLKLQTQSRRVPDVLSKTPIELLPSIQVCLLELGVRLKRKFPLLRKPQKSEITLICSFVETLSQEVLLQVNYRLIPKLFRSSTPRRSSDSWISDSSSIFSIVTCASAARSPRFSRLNRSAAGTDPALFLYLSTYRLHELPPIAA